MDSRKIVETWTRSSRQVYLAESEIKDTNAKRKNVAVARFARARRWDRYKLRMPGTFVRCHTTSRLTIGSVHQQELELIRKCQPKTRFRTKLEAIRHRILKLYLQETRHILAERL